MRSPLERLRETVGRELAWKRHQARWKRLVAEHPLRYLFFEVTRRCNLACAYCGSDCGPKGRAEELSSAEWIEIARQIATDFEPKKVMVAVTGGEPLLKDGVFELFAELKRLGFAYGMVSNGWLLDAEAARRLVECGMGSLSLSMDAPGELNDELRGRGSSEKVTAAIGHLRSAGYQGKLEIISTLTRPAVAQLDEMRRWIAAQRISLWRVAPVMPIGRAARRPELTPGPEEVRQMLEFVLNARQDRLKPAPEFCEEGFLGNRFEGRVRPYLSQCRAGVTTGGILCDGRIGACPELGEAFAQGDIRKERFKEVWETRYQALRDRHWAHSGDCARCNQFARCGGGSLHLYEQPGAPLLRCLYLMAKQAGEAPSK